jgi:hypothetical protein
MNSLSCNGLEEIEATYINCDELIINNSLNVGNILYDLNNIIKYDSSANIIYIYASNENEEILFNSYLSTYLYNSFVIPSKYLTIIDKYGKINIYHAQDITLPTRSEGRWIIHDELVQSQQGAIGLRFDVTNLPALASLQGASISNSQSSLFTTNTIAFAASVTSGTALSLATAALALAQQQTIITLSGTIIITNPSQWITISSGIIYNSTVGIGLTDPNPLYKLDVYGIINCKDIYIYIYGVSLSGNIALGPVYDYINTQSNNQQTYTDNQITTLRNEGLILAAGSVLLAWSIGSIGKKIRQKIWNRIKNKWLSFTGLRRYTEFVDDVENEICNELEDITNVYRYVDGLLSGWIAGIRCDPVLGKAICMKGNTYQFGGNLYLTGDIYKGVFVESSGVYTVDKKLNDYLVLKGTKSAHCLHIDNTTELIELKFDADDFELGPTPNYNLQFKHKVYGVKNKNGLYLDPTMNLIEINLDTEYLVVNSNQLSTTLLLKGVKSSNSLSIDSTTKLLEIKYNSDYLNVNASNQIEPVLLFKGVKASNSLLIDSITKQLEIKYDSDYLKINASNQLSTLLELKGCNFPFSINDTTKLLLLKYNVDNLKINSVNELDLVNPFHGADYPLSIDSTSKNLKLNYNSNDFEIVSNNLRLKLAGNSGLEIVDIPGHDGLK